MDKLKKRRKTLRTALTKLINCIPETDLDTLPMRVNVLDDFASELEGLDSEIFEELLDRENNEEACVLELDGQRDVKEKVFLCRKVALARMAPTNEGNADSASAATEDYAAVPRNPGSTTVNVKTELLNERERLKAMQHCDEIADAMSVMDGRKANLREFKLPKIALQKFDLCPNNYVSYWSQFEKIHRAVDIDPTTKFLYLRMCLAGKAKDLIETYPNTIENYEKALAHLKKRYGRDDLVINAIYSDLLKLIRERPPLLILYDIIMSKIRTLETFGFAQERAEILVPLIEECLPAEVLKVWKRQNVIRDKLDTLLQFIGKEAEIVEGLKECHIDEPAGPSTAPALVVTPAKKITCVFCNGEYYSNRCAAKLTVEQRRKLVTDKRLCFGCLRAGHNRKFCRTRVTCSKCKGRHYDIVCTGKREDGQTGTEKVKTPTQTSTVVSLNGETEKVGKVENTLLTMTGKESCMQILCCWIGNKKIRVLLDSASHRSYVTKRLVELVRLKLLNYETLRHVVFGERCSEEVVHASYELDLVSLDGKTQFRLTALEQEQICGKISAINVEMIAKMKGMGISLTDNCDGQEIDLLIGIDFMGNLITGMKVIDTNLIAYETRLGWTLLGAYGGSTISAVNVVFSLVSHPANLWDLEAIGIEKPTDRRGGSDDTAIANFEKNVEFVDGRYEVTLPWIEGHLPVEGNRGGAARRLKFVLDKLDASLYSAYDEVFRQWEADNIIERTEGTDTGHFLAHRPIVKRDKTTKVRPVFDASAKGFNGISLNDCLEKGPNLIAELFSILVRFRKNEVGIIGDIKQAFLMIGLKDESDREMLKFLWYRNDKEICYRHKRVVFGLTCSPFLLNATIQFHLKEAVGEFAEELRRSFYMDDCVVSVQSLPAAERFLEYATKIMRQGNFEIRGWVKSGDNVKTQVLGVLWDAGQGTLACQVKHKFQNSDENECTKRELLSIVNGFFDPLGIVAAPLLFIKLCLL